MESISSKDIREDLSDVLNRVAYKGKKYTITRSGKKVAVILSMEEWQLIEETMEKIEEQKDIRDANEARNRMIKEGGVSIEEARKELGI